MKYVLEYTLFIVIVSCTSCKGQNQTNIPQENNRPARIPNYSESQFAEADTARVPMSMVRNVKKASNGDILIASYLGVFRYDGTSFTNLTSKISSPRTSSFWDVLEDRKGNLWFGTRDSGIYCYPSGTLKTGDSSYLHFTTKDGLGGNSAIHIYEDKTGNIWFGSTLYDGKTFRHLTTRDGFPGNNFRLLLEDKSGKLWFGGQGEDMFVYDGKSFSVLKNKEGKAFNNVWSIIEDKKGTLWFGDADGLWRYEGGIFTNVSMRGAYGIMEDKKGNIWTTGEVNSNVWALSCYDAKSLYDKIPTVTEIRSGGRMAFLGLLEADDGSIWYGSGVGVHRYDGKTFTDFKSAPGQK